MITDGGRLEGTVQVKWLPLGSSLHPSCKNIESPARLSRRANGSKVIREASMDFGLLICCVNVEKLSSLSLISPQIKHLQLPFSYLISNVFFLSFPSPPRAWFHLARLFCLFVQSTVRSFRKRRSNTRTSIWQSTTQSLIKWTSSLTKK